MTERLTAGQDYFVESLPPTVGQTLLDLYALSNNRIGMPPDIAEQCGQAAARIAPRVLGRVRQTLQSAADDPPSLKRIEDRWDREHIMLPDELRRSQRETEQKTGSLSVMGWLGYHASDNELVDALSWNSDHMMREANDEVWYAELEPDLLAIERAFDNAMIARTPAHVHLRERFLEEGDYHGITIAQPLDTFMGVAHGYYVDNEKVVGGNRIVPRHYDHGVVLHEFIHGHLNLANGALNEGLVQQVTRQLLAYNELDQRYDARRAEVRASERSGVPPAWSRQILPESVYPELSQAITILRAMVSTEKDPGFIEACAIGDDMAQNQQRLGAVVTDAIGVDLLSFCDSEYERVYEEGRDADTTLHQRVARGTAQAAVAQAVIGASYLLQHSSVYYFEPGWAPVRDFLRQAGKI